MAPDAPHHLGMNFSHLQEVLLCLGSGAYACLQGTSAEVKCFMPVLAMDVDPQPCCSWHVIRLSCLKGGNRNELLGWLLLPARLNVLIISFCNTLVEVLCSELTEPDPPRSDHMLVSLKKCLINPLCYSFVPPPKGKRCFSSFSLLIKKKRQLPSWNTPCKLYFLQ